MRINAPQGWAWILFGAASRKTRPEPATVGRNEGSIVMTSVASTAASLAFVAFLGAGTAFGQSLHDQHHPQAAPALQGMPMQPGTMGQGMAPGRMGQMGPGMMGPGMMGQMGPGPGMMGSGGPGMGPDMMGPGMMGQGMHPGMGQMPGMMGQMGPGMMGQMGSGMMGQMGPGMMGHGYGPGMMGPGMMGQMPGAMGPGMHGFRVVPMMHLSTDDVRRFLQRHISAHNLEHLQVGEVTATDDETITADIVTREGSLALRLEIDAYTGFVKDMS
jgi:hypothetical protein